MKLLLLFAPFVLLFGQTANPPIDNEFAHVIVATDQPAQAPGREHEHKMNRVMIYLDAGDIQIKYADGRVENQHWKAGDVAWSPAGGLHTSQNVSAKAVRIVEIELKNEMAGGKWAYRMPRPLLENNQVRVYRTAEAPTVDRYIAVDEKTGTVLWNKMPAGAGPFVVAEIK